MLFVIVFLKWIHDKSFCAPEKMNCIVPFWDNVRHVCYIIYIGWKESHISHDDVRLELSLEQSRQPYIKIPFKNDFDFNATATLLRTNPLYSCLDYTNGIHVNQPQSQKSISSAQTFLIEMTYALIYHTLLYSKASWKVS